MVTTQWFTEVRSGEAGVQIGGPGHSKDMYSEIAHPIENSSQHVGPM